MFIVAGVLLVAGLISTVSGQCKTPFDDCGSTHMKFSSITVPNCCGPPCILKRGTNATVIINFSTDVTYASMTENLCGEFNPACLTLPSLPVDFCKFTTCPIEAGKAYSAKIELAILKDYPPVSVTGKWTFYGPGDNTTTVGCFEVPLKIE